MRQRGVGWAASAACAAAPTAAAQGPRAVSQKPPRTALCKVVIPKLPQFKTAEDKVEKNTEEGKCQALGKENGFDYHRERQQLIKSQRLLAGGGSKQALGKENYFDAQLYMEREAQERTKRRRLRDGVPRLLEEEEKTTHGGAWSALKPEGLSVGQMHLASMALYGCAALETAAAALEEEKCQPGTPRKQRHELQQREQLCRGLEVMPLLRLLGGKHGKPLLYDIAIKAYCTCMLEKPAHAATTRVLALCREVVSSKGRKVEDKVVRCLGWELSSFFDWSQPGGICCGVYQLLGARPDGTTTVGTATAAAGRAEPVTITFKELGDLLGMEDKLEAICRLGDAVHPDDHSKYVGSFSRVNMPVQEAYDKRMKEHYDGITDQGWTNKKLKAALQHVQLSRPQFYASCRLLSAGIGFPGRVALWVARYVEQYRIYSIEPQHLLNSCTTVTLVFAEVETPIEEVTSILWQRPGSDGPKPALQQLIASGQHWISRRIGREHNLVSIALALQEMAPTKAAATSCERHSHSWTVIGKLSIPQLTQRLRGMLQHWAQQDQKGVAEDEAGDSGS